MQTVKGSLSETAVTAPNDTRVTKLQALYRWALCTEGSTRSSALIRIGLVLTVWTRWADELLLFRHLADGRWPMCIVFFVCTTLALVGAWSRISVPAAAGCTLY